MITPDIACERVAALVDRARKAGADVCDAVFSAESSEGVQVRLGKLEDISRSESEHIGLRVFVGKRSASIGSSDLGDAALSELATRAVAMASAAPEDMYAGLAAEELLLKDATPELDMFEAEEPSPQSLRAMAEEAEDAARAVSGVTNSEGGSASAGQGLFALATSHGFAKAYAGTSRGISASVIAGEGAGMQRDYAWRSARYSADLPPPEEIGTQAGERAVARLNPGTLKSGPMPVLFSPRVSATLLGHLISAMSGSAIARRASFLLDRLDETLFDRSIVIRDEPHRQRSLSSRPFDGEGLPTAARNLVEQGKLTGWLMDSASARQLGLAPTGHASRGGAGAPGVGTSNLHLAAGSVTPTALMADIKEGVLVTELIGMGVNGVTGDYSRGATGLRIVGGELAGPVAEFTIAGNLLEMFKAMIPADDLEWHRAVNAPTVRIDGMTIAGE